MKGFIPYHTRQIWWQTLLCVLDTLRAQCIIIRQHEIEMVRNSGNTA
jgi:hypothetical protein